MPEDPDPDCLECDTDALVTIVHHTGPHPRDVKTASLCPEHFRGFVKSMATKLRDDENGVFVTCANYPGCEGAPMPGHDYCPTCRADPLREDEDDA